MSGLWSGRQRTDASNRDGAETSKTKTSAFRRPSLVPRRSNRDSPSKDVFMTSERRSISMPFDTQSSNPNVSGQYASTSAETPPFHSNRHASTSVSSAESRPSSVLAPSGGYQARSPIILARDSDKASPSSGTYYWGSAWTMLHV